MSEFYIAFDVDLQMSKHGHGQVRGLVVLFSGVGLKSTQRRDRSSSGWVGGLS